MIKRTNIPRTRKRKAPALVCIIVFAAALSGCAISSPLVPRAEKGILDLREWDFSSDGIINLNGEWFFYWKKFIKPENIKSEKEVGYCSVPGSWTKAAQDITSRGFATYRLKILMPKKSGPLVIKFRNIHTAYQAYCNGRLIARQGQTAKYSDDSKPETTFQTARIKNAAEVNLVIHVSNFHHKDGGIIISSTMGAANDIIKSDKAAIMIDFFIFGSIFIIGLYCMIIFALKRDDRTFLYFSLVCFIVATRIFIFGNINYNYIADYIHWSLIYRTAVLGFYLAILSFTWYVYHLYTEEFPLKVIKVISGIIGILSVIVLFADTMTVSQIIIYSHVITLSTCLFILFVLIRAAARKKKGTKIFLSGFIIILAVIVNDILYDNLVIQTAFLMPVGLFIFLILQTVLLSQRYTDSLINLEKISQKLDSNNDDLIRALVNLKFSQEHLIRQEKMAAIGNLAAGMAHEIRNQLSAITFLELLETPITDEEEEAIESVIESRDQISSIINEVRAMAKNETTAYSFSIYSVTDIVKETLTLAAISPSIKHDALTLKMHYGGSILGDKHKIIQMLIHLLENASSAIEEEGDITLTTALEKEKIIFEVKDTGIGIDPAIRDEIWDPFFTSWGKDHAGIGLDLCRRIAEGHGGKIACSSKVGEGTSFTIIFPIDTEHSIADRGSS